MTLSYELAKELKDAGFSQGDGDYAAANGNWYGFEPSLDNPPTEKYGEVAYAPTLSELIEACGTGAWFHLYHLRSGEWETDCANLSTADGVKGPTPDEAVARLWLALNASGAFDKTGIGGGIA